MASGSYEFTTWLEEGQIHHGMEEEEEAIRYYFRGSYDYNAILEFLDKYHDIRMSKRTLLNRLRDYGRFEQAKSQRRRRSPSRSY